MGDISSPVHGMGASDDMMLPQATAVLFFPAVIKKSIASLIRQTVFELPQLDAIET